MGGPIAGFWSLARAAGMFLRHPVLIVYALLPAAVTMAVTAVTIPLLLDFGPDLIGSWWGKPEGGAGIAVRIAEWIAGALSVLLVVLVVPWLVMLVGFPLCEPLAAAVERRVAGGVPDSGRSLLAEILDSFLSSLGILAVGLGGSLVLLVAGLFPGAALVTVPLAAFVWTPLVLALDLFDSPLSRRRLGLKRKLGVLRGNLGAALALGLAAAPLLTVPFLNLLGLPLAVVAGVLLCADLSRSRP